ncbi:hypothetical protein J3F83DRAFT_729892 [Trichoderma novae-zelandiae]
MADAQVSHSTLVNLPPPESNPDTPSEMPGTPTSTTTSLSALSTTAIKDGHRGHLHGGLYSRGHQHNPSATILEAERADRISRLAGLERVSTLRPPQTPTSTGRASSLSPQTTPTSTAGFPPNYPPTQHLTPAYFDSNGQPVAVTKMSTVGTASATESHPGDSEDRRTAGDRDEDMLSTDTNYREAESVTSTGVDHDGMDDLEGLGNRSTGTGFDDRMSDDGSVSLVGFGEGAGSTVSGPIYHRRPVPGAAHQWGLERTNSGLSEARRERDSYASGAGDTPMSAAAIQERQYARMMDGVATDGPPANPLSPDQDVFVDTTFRGPVLVGRQPPRETAESIVQRLDSGESTAGPSGMGSPGRAGDKLGRFYFETDKRED